MSWTGINSSAATQPVYFAQPGEARARLMQNLDKLNNRFGGKAVAFATAHVPRGERAPWSGKDEFRSAAYTTNWDELWSL